MKKREINCFFGLLMLLLSSALQDVYANNEYIRQDFEMDKVLSIMFVNEPIENVLAYLEQEAGVTFWYQTKILKNINPISIKFDKVALRIVLGDITSKTGLVFKGMGDHTVAILNEISPQKRTRQAQEYTISGVVTDERGGLMPGVTVVEKGTKNGVSSNFDGYYEINLSSLDAVLEYRYVGYKIKEVVVKDSNPINVQLFPDTSKLEEVVVIGYGTQKKKEVTGAVSVLASQTILELNPTRIEQALQGQVAGVQITSTSGAPGEGLNIRIRGVSTNGDNRPLILVDGNVIEDLNVLNPNDIESINVIKDATASIYGARAANGVIIIVTKTGKKNAPMQINYTNSLGMQEAMRVIPVLNSREYAAILNESYVANGQLPPFTDIDNITTDTNWQEEVLSTVPIQQHNLNFSGGFKDLTYSLGGSFLSQDGIVGEDKANFTRYTGKLNLNYDFLDNFSLTTSTIYTKVKTKTLPQNELGSPLFNALNMPPTLPIYDENNEYTLPENGLGNEIVNPIQQIDNIFNTAITKKISGSYGLNYRFLDGFSLEGRFQFNYSKVNSDNFYPPINFGSGKSANRVEEDDRYRVVDETYRDYTIDGLLRYEKNILDDHNVKALFGYSYFKTEKLKDFQNTAIDLPSGTTYSTATLNDAETLISLDVPLWESKLLSLFGRLQYDYKGKYLFSASLRRDGSSIFGPKNRFGYFPSFSFGWIVTEEPFVENISWLSFLKLRGSFGIIGNDRIAESGGTYRSVINVLNVGRYAFGQDVILQGSGIGVLGNPTIKWEEQETYNFGFDLTLLKDKFNLTFDYFNKITNDLLVTPQVSGILGSTSPGSGAPVVNAGSIENNGLELSLGYNQTLFQDVTLSVNTNFSTISNNVLSISNEEGYISGGNFGVGQDPPSRMEAGYPIGYFYGYKTQGVFQTQSEVDQLVTLDSNGKEVEYQQYGRPGEFKYMDLDGDGRITNKDKTYIGDPIPDWTFGINISLKIKNWDIQSYGFASYGNEIVRNYERTQPNVNKLKYTLNRWTNEGSTNEYPYVTVGNTLTTVFSDYYVEDGSFFKIQNAQIGYSFPKNILDKIHLKKLRIFGSVNNIYTFTKYMGYDPSFSSGDPIGGGIDNGFYPSARTYMLGLNITI